MNVSRLIESYKIKLSPYASVKHSEESGYGLYLDVQSLALNSEPRTVDQDVKSYEIVRIPLACHLSVKKCAQVVNGLQPRYKETVNSFFSELLQDASSDLVLTETLFLVLYVTFLMILDKDGPFAEYFKVLEKTQIETPVTELARELEQQLNGPVSQYYQLLHNDGWDNAVADLLSLVNRINELVSGLGKTLTVLQFVHIRDVVRSRVLEIPHADEEDPDDDSFYVETTLVPVLDFANHDEVQKNLYFDVDRETEDVLLIFETSTAPLPKSSSEQVFISYTPFEDLKHFLFNYGFVPATPKVKSLEICMDRDYLQKHYHKTYLFGKYFKSLPNVQFLVSLEDSLHLQVTRLNLSNKYTFLSFLPDLKLTENSELLPMENDLEQDFLLEAGPKDRFTFRDVELESSISIMDVLEEKEIEEALKEYFQMLKNYFEFKIPQLEELPKTDTMAYKLVDFQIKAMRSFIERLGEIDDDVFELVEFAPDFDAYRVRYRGK